MRIRSEIIGCGSYLPERVVTNAELSAKIDTTDEIVARAEEAMQHVDGGRLSLNPDCGFAPDAGEPPTIDEAYQKLCNLAEAARRLRRSF